MYIDIPFVGPDYANRSSNVNDQKTVNMYPRTQGAGAKAPVVLYPTPGLVKKGSASSGVWRSNAVLFKGNLYAVCGTDLYKITSELSPTSVGTLNSSGGRCVLAVGRSYIAIVDGTDGYSYNGTTFAQITDVDFPAGPTHITYLDSFFITNESGSDQFWKSASENPTSWAALDFATAEANPDDILAHTASYKDLYLIGSETTQLYYNSGNPSFPFDPYSGGTIDIGIKAPYSLASSSAGLFWLSTTKEGDIAVVHAQGAQIRGISNDIAWDLTSMTVTEDAYAFTYRQNNQLHYQITFPSEDKTFEYILEENQWIERKSKGVGRYKAAGHGYISNSHAILAYDSAFIYEMDFSAYSDGGDEIDRIRRAPVIHQSHHRMIFHELVVEFEAGTGLNTGQGQDPQAMLRYSDDGGHTWSNELWEPIGKIGEYKARSQWTALGQSRQRIYEVKVTDPVNVTIIKAYARITLCNS